MSAAFKLMEDAFDAKRREMYCIAWESVDFYGIPDRELPERQRQDIAKWIKQ